MKAHYNLSQLRNAFWENHKQFRKIRGYTQNQYCTDIRCAWVDFIDSMRRQDYITEKMAQRATL